MNLQGTRIAARDRAKVLRVKMLRESVEVFRYMGYRSGWPLHENPCWESTHDVVAKVGSDGRRAVKPVRPGMTVAYRADESGQVADFPEPERRALGDGRVLVRVNSETRFAVFLSQLEGATTTKALPRSVPGLPVGDVPVRAHPGRSEARSRGALQRC